MAATIHARLPLRAPADLARKLAAARSRIMTGMALVPEASLNRHERCLVNQVLERQYQVGHLRRDIRLPNARMLRPHHAWVPETQDLFLHYLAIPETHRQPLARPAEREDAGAIYATEVPEEAWQRHADTHARLLTAAA